ncbi:MAG: Mut7-C RNAse domain-containing protein [Deltaproteobacteria bacterium]|nr:Mut7-C RNAse domain-containing protein [Deltaproteobacteria bacterium]MBZ0221202.1 Mut7-C RNAse domain-containing protein [Deltaproteobacteria bacterium]
MNGNPRFFADSMLGKLARWMRTLGYDVEYDPSIEDGELVRRAAAGGRIVLTRDTRLIKRKAVRNMAFFIRGDRIEDQLREVASAYPPEKGMLLTRCLRCNAVLEDVPRESIRGKVPPYVYATQAGFSACPVCRRIYWGGTHKTRMVEELKRMLSG